MEIETLKNTAIYTTTITGGSFGGYKLAEYVGDNFIENDYLSTLFEASVTVIFFFTILSTLSHSYRNGYKNGCDDGYGLK